MGFRSQGSEQEPVKGCEIILLRQTVPVPADYDFTKRLTAWKGF